MIFTRPSTNHRDDDQSQYVLVVVKVNSAGSPSASGARLVGPETGVCGLNLTWSDSEALYNLFQHV